MSESRAKGTLQKPDEPPTKVIHLPPVRVEKKQDKSPAGSRSSSPSSTRHTFSDFFHLGKHAKKQQEPQEPQEETKEFKHAFLNDDEHGLLYDAIKPLIKKYKLPEYNEIERIQKYIAKLEKLREQVVTESRIKEENNKAFQWNGSTEEKTDLIEALQERQTTFIEKSRRKIEKLEKIFLFDTQCDLYDQLKQIILNPQWEDALFKNNKAILKATILDHEENEISIPVGIEKMMRIVADMPAPKRKTICGFFYYKPTPIFRSQVERNEELTGNIILDKITRLREVAIEQVNSNQQTTLNEFYEKLKQLNPLQLNEVNALTVYIHLFAPFVPKSGSQSSNDEQTIVIDGMHAAATPAQGYGSINQ